MKKTTKNLTLLTSVFCTALVISNVVTARIIPFFGSMTIAGAVLIYPITFLITDVVGEVWGKKEANAIVKYGFISQCIATALIVLTGMLPCVSSETASAYNTILGQNWIIVLGSMIAYYMSQTWDVYIFHKIRDKYLAKHKTTKGGRWIWNNASTITSQLIDSVVFILISFGLGFGWIKNGQWNLVWNMLAGQYLVKVILALLDTPLFYLFTKTTKMVKE